MYQYRRFTAREFNQDYLDDVNNALGLIETLRQIIDKIMLNHTDEPGEHLDRLNDLNRLYVHFLDHRRNLEYVRDESQNKQTKQAITKRRNSAIKDKINKVDHNEIFDNIVDDLIID